MTATTFRSAVPVWEKGTETEKNISLLFTANIPQTPNTTLKIAGHTRFIVKVNGKFLAAGPARAGHGFYRTDEYDISALLTEKRNVVSILCAGYNTNSFAYLDMPSFLCCEIYSGNTCLAATGKDSSFAASRYTERVRKVQRYSFQRPYAEVYRFGADYDLPETDSDYTRDTVTLEQTEEKRFIERDVYYPEYEKVFSVDIMERGTVTHIKPEAYYADRAITAINNTLGGFPQNELETISAHEAQELQTVPSVSAISPAAPVSLSSDSYVTYRLPKNLTGFLTLTVQAKEDMTLYITFDEVYNNNQVNFLRLQCSNVIVWNLKGGRSYDLMTFEPYTLQYMNVIAVGGAAEITVPALIRYDFPAGEITKAVPMPDETLQSIYDAAVESFRQNTLDIYMDCPSRERAGWLCDSFFTARSEYALTGRSTTEHAFLDNFLMPESFKYLPDGMLPMCYPSDHYDGVFIPNWAMWFVLQLEEYFLRTGDRKLVTSARDRVYNLLSYYKKFENRDGLLEKLESWVFIEWSRSNDLVQDISYPSNMLYARMLQAAASLYDDKALADKASALMETIRNQSFMGKFFCDNAVYDEDGKTRLSGEATESCQYYAFFTGVASPETYPELWNTLVNDFGPDRKNNNKYPEIALANSFVGNYLRLDLLFRQGMYDKVLENIRGYFKYMADKTGTLWENSGDYASCNHGFASHVVCWLNGIYH